MTTSLTSSEGCRDSSKKEGRPASPFLQAGQSHFLSLGGVSSRTPASARPERVAPFALLPRVRAFMYLRVAGATWGAGSQARPSAVPETAIAKEGVGDEEERDGCGPPPDGEGRTRDHARAHPKDVLGTDLRGGRRGRHGDPRDRPAPDQGRRERVRPDELRPRVHEHGIVQERDYLHRWRQGHPALPGLSYRAARRGCDVPGGGVAAAQRRAADAA